MVERPARGAGIHLRLRRGSRHLFRTGCPERQRIAFHLIMSDDASREETSLVLVGINHRTAPIEIRERLAWPEREVANVVEALVERGGRGAVLLTTCNRTEFYLSDPSPDTLREIWKRAEVRIGAPADQYAYVVRDREVARHLFRVASGLDSLVVGESQIQGQVREAWEMSRVAAGPVLHRLFQAALGAGGRVRSETPLGTGSASIPSACVDLANTNFAD